MLKIYLIIITGVILLLYLILDSKYRKRLFWLWVIIVLLCGVKEYFQIFLGVPIRLFSAFVLEKIFHLININTINQNSILIFENGVINIDYPCSGVLTVYYTIFFISIISFLKNSALSLSLFFKILLCNFFAIFLNMVRIFILLILNINNFSLISDKIHGVLGMINYLLICLLFLLLIKQNNNENNSNKHACDRKNIFEISILIIFFLFLIFVFYFRYKTPSINDNFEIIKDKTKNNLDFSKEEINYYKKAGGKIEKYEEENNIIIKIKSNSPLALHNPLICFKNQNIKILNTKTTPTQNGYIKELETDRGKIYYYFKDNKTITDDYYKIAFFSLFNRKEKELVIILQGNHTK